MSGTRSPSKTAPATESLWKLGAILWPFVAGAVAINVFLLGLIFHSAGWSNAISPVASLLWALPLSVPATWLAARWVRGLIREAEGR
ncbi:hypothetical protein OEZ71_14430 [Defluviimonas sp. WL0050]|uniref:NnrT protein n=1 Tax=Albidovulum litorale TaxID=2984134 RepID=A0ABT2ZR64_9RHOB|nr:hypothetical protein [Defluviimonas sp. WL0050]MCV2873494.1 hypothetical protein [Defluviimonas sp. WL0050]